MVEAWLDGLFDSCLGGIAFISILFVAIFGFAGVISYVSGNIGCAHAYENSGFEYRYDFWAGCMIKVNSKWIPQDIYRNVEVHK